MKRPSAGMRLAGTLLGCVALHSVPALSATASCEALAKLKLPETVAIAAHDMPAGTYKLAQLLRTERLPPRPPGFKDTFDLPAFCRVALTVAPQIRIEVWLPKTTWNGRYRGEGGGGYAGEISYHGLAEALRAGYATASTDTGHPWWIGGSFALNADRSLNHQLIVDFASRSLQEMVRKAKRLIKAYYGKAQRYSYWSGCSTGGRQGLMAVQRFPEEYDGVLAGCPAINWDRFIPAELWAQVVMKQELGRPIDAAKLEAVSAAAVTACDSVDGVMDGILNDPRKCRYDPSAAVCRNGDDATRCLTPEEAKVVRKIWDGPTSPTTGERLWFGVERGAPLSGVAGANPFVISTDYFKYWIKQDPYFDWQMLTEADFEHALHISSEKFNAMIGTDKVDLQRFRQRGGKLLMWHGENDEVIFPRGTLNYFERVLAANGGGKEVAQFVRLFLMPGIGHCINNDKAPYTDGLFEALVNWVEKGVAPDRLTATQKLPDGTVRTRPLCAYPTTAKWTGAGSPDDVGNFACVDGEHNRTDFSVTAPGSN